MESKEEHLNPDDLVKNKEKNKKSKKNTGEEFTGHDANFKTNKQKNDDKKE